MICLNILDEENNIRALSEKTFNVSGISCEYRYMSSICLDRDIDIGTRG